MFWFILTGGCLGVAKNLAATERFFEFGKEGEGRPLEKTQTVTLFTFWPSRPLPWPTDKRSRDLLWAVPTRKSREHCARELRDDVYAALDTAADCRGRGPRPSKVRRDVRGVRGTAAGGRQITREITASFARPDNTVDQHNTSVMIVIKSAPISSRSRVARNSLAVAAEAAVGPQLLVFGNQPSCLADRLSSKLQQQLATGPRFNRVD